MKTAIFTVLIMALLLALAAPPAAAGVTIAHAERLEHLSIRHAELRRNGLVRERTSVTMQFDAMGRRFDIALDPNTALLPAAAQARLAANISVLRGRVSGGPGSWARIVLVDGRPNGLVYDGNEMLAIESPVGSEPRIFRLADIEVEPGTMSCAAGSEPLTGQQMYDALVAELTPRVGRAMGAVEEIEIGAVGDASFSSGRADPQEAILIRLNNVDGIYSNELGIQITATIVETFDDASDPLSTTTDSDALLRELSDYRAANSQQNARGLTHLFTGRTLDGSTVGIAYIGVLCSTAFGVGLSENSRGLTTDSLIAAHEIGHNFGASHDGDTSGSCPNASPNQFIMAARVNGNPQFSDCSKSVMLTNAAEAACVVALPGTDLRVTSFNQPESILLGNPLTLNFAIDNRGASTVFGATAEITLPTNVTLVAAAPTRGTCSSGAGTISCDLGSIAGSSGVTLSLTVNTDAPGDAAFTAEVAAFTDEIASNNLDTHTVSIEPAVNLVVSAPAAQNVDLGANLIVDLPIANTSILDATGVTATIVLLNGISASNATWDAGACTVAAQQVICSADSLAALSATTLVLDLRGVIAGTRSFTVALAATETDANAVDNDAVVTVTVSGGGRGISSPVDDGGGSAGAVLLGLLAAAGLRRRIRREECRV